MIEFKCQHCGKGLHLNDSYAGRDGWCRVCKRMVIVPGAGPVSRVEDLPPEEGYERLQRLLQYAATKADKYKIYLARQAKEQEHAALVEEALQQAQLALAERESARERLQGEYDALAASFHGQASRIAELEAIWAGASAAPELELELGALRADLALERESRQALSAAVAERAASFAVLEQEAAALRQAAAEHLHQEEAAAADRVNLRALEGAVATLKSELHQAESERDRLASILEDGATGGPDSTLELLQKDREIGALSATLGELKAQQEESNRATRDQIAALEGQVLLFNEIKERLGGLQGRIRELEQERLDTSLALDGARQSGALLQNKIAALEGSLQVALAAQGERGIQSEHLQRELAVRDEQVRKLTEELQVLTEGQGSAMLAQEKSARAARSAESRAERLAAEIEEVQLARDRVSAENDVLRRGAVEAEARVASLNESLAAARADVAAKAAHKPAMAALQAELSAARLALQHAEEEGAAAQVSRNYAVAELQAEVMNLSQALHREEEKVAEAQARIQSLPALASDVARAQVPEQQAALAAAEQRIAALEAQVEQREERASLHQVEEEHLARSLSESRARIQWLEAALASAGTRATGAGASGADEDFAGDEGDVGFILLSPESEGNTLSPSATLQPDGVDERRRHIEKKQMMDVLSDFLNK